jgi:hypothetical protein
MAYKIKRFSKQIGYLNTNGAEGFIKGRKYDTDLNRLGRAKTTLTSELSSNQLSNEMRKNQKELNKYGNIQSTEEI